MFRLVFALVFLGVFCTALFSQTEPEWQWNEQAGGSGDDRGVAIAVDSQENQYLVGEFNGTATFGGTSLVSEGGFDVCVAKMDASGNWLWARRAGGNYQDHGTGIAVDSAGNAYITGYFEGTAWFGSTSLTSAGNIDIFIAKLDSGGNWLWARRAGAGYTDSGSAIAVNNAGEVFVTGNYYYDVSFGSTILLGSGWDDVFVAKLDANGNWLWAVKAGGSSIDRSSGLAVDSASNVYVTGYFYGSASFGSIILTSTSSFKIFVAKLGFNGSWNWAMQAGGPDLDSGFAIATDSAANVYVTGVFRDVGAFGETVLTSSGNSDLFAAKIDPEGNWLWARRAGGSGVDNGNGIAVDAEANVYLCGSFSSTADFGAHVLTSSGSTDIFVAKLAADGNWQWVKRAGGSSSEGGLSIVVNEVDDAYITGWFMGSAAFEGLPINSVGGTDIFAAKLSLEVEIDEELAPPETDQTGIYGLWPNPLPKSETLHLLVKIAERESGILSLHNLRGQNIASYVLGPGSRELCLASGELASGVYLCRLKTPSTAVMKKLVVWK